MKVIDQTPAGPTTRSDIIWTPFANHIACPECGAVTSGPHTCKPKTVAAVGIITGRITTLRTPTGTCGRVAPTAVVEARRTLRSAREQLGRPTLRGVKRWQAALRADGARALLSAAGVTA